MDYEKLDPGKAPLSGVRLIEASAGTGKTWVIAALYVRAVLGHGGQPERLPPEILVVTFTRDATAELRERIRGRLEEAAAAFRAGVAEDPFLAGLLADYRDEGSRMYAARRLSDAAQWMDEASIHTIHGWANRMLARHAFDSGRSFVEAAEADEHEHVSEACRDYWRREVYPLSAAQFAQVQMHFDGPDALAKVVYGLLPKPLTATVEGGVAPKATLAASLESAFSATRAALDASREAWRDHLVALRSVHDVLTEGLSRNKKPGRHLARWIDQLEAWIHGGPLELGSDELALMSPANLAGALNKGKVLPPCSAYAAAESLANILEQVPSAQPVVLRHVLHVLPAVIERAKTLRGEIGFDDMLSELNRSLQGEQGARLAQVICTQLPIALIDEFQDTDPLQWQIFERIYRGQGTLLLIGDPKQSIYRFRGADIGTYFQARQAVAQPALTLARNFRSTESMVSAVNALFVRAEELAEDGAFGYGKGAEGLRFEPVDAEGRSDFLVEDGLPSPALTIAVPDGDAPLNKGAYTEVMAEAAAERVATWLVHGRTARIADRKKSDRRVRPSDIAILVRNRSEAEQIQSALRRRGIASVYLSDKQSVFASKEAADLLHWLAALAEPGSDRALRAALATGSARHAFAEIDQVAQDDLIRDRLIEIFTTGAQLWRERGVLAAVRHLIHALELPARHAGSDSAERCFTNLLHVAELLQHAAVHLDGEHALLRYLADAIETSEEPDGDASGTTVQRLESEADLVRVVTIHKSKGLQYKLVVIPFACSFRDVKGKTDRFFEFERDGARIVSLEATDEATEAARLATIREEVRLFYVAITRAELACWIGAAAVFDGGKKTNGIPFSGFGRLLGGGAELGAEGLRKAIEALSERTSSIQMVLLPEPIPLTQAPISAPVQHLPPPRPVQAPQAPAWWLSSYSGLIRGPRRVGVDAGSAAELVALEEYGEPRLPSGDPVDVQTMHGFPRGPSFGSFLHYLLEWAAMVGFDRIAADPGCADAEIVRRAETAGLSGWIPVLQAWLPQFLAAPLPLPGGRSIALQDLRPSSARPEFAFMIEANTVCVATLDAVVTEHFLPGRARPPLTQKHLNGMLSGFIDLVFEHEGAWYTLDYKSNHLADATAGYSQAVMIEEMLDHRYDLQASLYSLALHRFLRSRLADYEPDRHLGGVVYPFLRGVGPDTGVFVVKPGITMLDAMDAIFAGDLTDAT